MRVMTTYTAYRYSASLPIEWQGMEFATHDHTAEGRATSVPADVRADAVAAEQRRYSVLPETRSSSVEPTAVETIPAGV